MRLLICTQAVNATDSDLGFFIRWIEEFAKRCEKVTVICLRAGEHSLPDAIEVIALGKTTRLVRTLRLWRACVSRRGDYDAVFVHMNPEYVIAAGLLWRLMHKRIALWYTHKSVDLKLRVAVTLANIIFTASQESFRLKSAKVRVMGHGIDTEFFTPDRDVPRTTALLSVGRLSPSKRHDVAIEKAARERQTLRIAGEGPERARLEARAAALHASVIFLGPLTREALRREYRSAARLLHTSETGSLDKVVLEALACGLPVETSDPALAEIATRGPDYVREHHSLTRLIGAICGMLKNV